MTPPRYAVLDGNEAAASVAYRASEVLAIYPITPSSTMGELADAWSAGGRENLWGAVPEVVEMQSEGGAAGAVHGALQTGALATTFTASQGLLLMIPNMYKIAGELTAFCMHVAARSLATHALSIFGDHSDVMACRQTGFALLASGSVQEAHDLAAVAHAATLRSRVPFLHFFDGFRTSHELSKIAVLDDALLRTMLDDAQILAHRRRALTPDRPLLRGTAQNPDTFFQAREAGNRHYLALPGTVQEAMDQLARATGRAYRLFDYTGHPQAERVIVIMGSGAEAAHEVAERLVAEDQNVGVLKVRLYRPFSVEAFSQALPASVRAIAVLDRTKEPGAVGEPLYQDVVAALREVSRDGISVIGGRYGLSSKEFDPPMIKAVFDALHRPMLGRHFTVGIVDDVTHTSLTPDAAFEMEEEGRLRAVFYGLGSDGTVSANKNSIKILGEDPAVTVQGYFVYDSKKSGSVTTSHLRFGKDLIRSTYLVRHADFVACHQFPLLFRLDVLERALPGAIFLLNAPYPESEVWDRLPREVQQQIVAKRLRLYAIDAHGVARDSGLGQRINTIMQTCFFALSGVLPRERAVAAIKAAVEKTYGARGAEIVKKNFAAIDAALLGLHEIDVPAGATCAVHVRPPVADDAPDFVQRVTAAMLAGRGDLLPVSAFPPDGTWPVGTSQYEKRNIAHAIPVWDRDLCIQCNKCTLLCPHATIRAKAYPREAGEAAPPGFRAASFRSREHEGWDYTLQVAPEDCTGCGVCVEVCPAKDKANPRRKALRMELQEPLLEAGREHWEFFLTLPEMDRASLRLDVKGSQFLTPLFEFSGACSGCGETPYVKLLTQLFGDRLLMANATGCSSIYGGNLPTTPYTKNGEGRGPAWSNSLFEDNAEFGLGMRLALDSHARQARALVEGLAAELGEDVARAILDADQSTEGGIAAQRARVAHMLENLGSIRKPETARLAELADYLVEKSVWIVGGDGWAYDIGFGGLDHVLHSGRNVNVLVLDTEVYSNTGGQQSKATPTGAVAKFAALGKTLPKKDLARIAMGMGHVYVAQVAIGARDAQTVRAFLEAEAYSGPSLILAYSPCIAHGYDLVHGPEQQRLAVESGMWPLLRFDPRRQASGEPPLQLDMPAPKISPAVFMANEARFRMLEKSDPARWQVLLEEAKRQASSRWAVLEQLARVSVPAPALAGA